MRIAIIGSGISGLTAAYLLSPHASVTLYEKDNRLGGHAHTSFVPCGHVKMPVDTGFMVFNPARYPHFISLLNQLGVEPQNTNMSFSVSIPEQIEYSGSIAGLFADPRQLLRPTYWRFLSEIPRFNAAARHLLETDSASITLGEFLDTHAFSPTVREWYIYPMIGSIWSTDTSQIRDFPARETLCFLDNHQLLSIIGGPQWKTIPGGSKTYVKALTENLLQSGVIIKTNKHIERITRSPIRMHTETIETFDALVLATHADEALALLADATTDERAILGAFSYSRNTAMLHSDESFMPRRRSAWAAWNYHAPRTTTTGSAVSLTYNMNLLQHIPADFPTFVTINPQHSVAPEAIFQTHEYTHPIANTAARKAQARLPMIQGKRGTYFAGAYWGNGFHEDGVVSAIHAVRTLGISIPQIV